MLSSTFTSCEIINPAEPIPTYIHIPGIDLQVLDTSSSGQGSGSHKITDAWVYIDNQAIGAFELPVTLPALVSPGNHRIMVRAGIKMNGIAATRTQYPFYTSYEIDADLQPGQVTSLIPVVKYYTTATFEWIEDFEGSGFKISKSPYGTDTVMKTVTGSNAFEGVKSGVVNLDANRTYFEGVSSTALNIPKNTPVFLEMNYRCNQTFAVGVYASNSNNPLIALNLNASEDWNKIYVNLHEVINTPGFNPPFTFFIGMLKDASVTDPVLYLDNLKIIKQ